MASVQLTGVQVVGLHRWFAPQVLPAGQVDGQTSSWPQPSPMVPQYWSLLARLHEVIFGQVCWFGAADVRSDRAAHLAAGAGGGAVQRAAAAVTDAVAVELVALAVGAGLADAARVL